MSDVRWQQAATERFRTILLLLFAAGAVVLALVGIFGVVSYAVVQRVREVGVCAALGAGPRDIILMMMRQALLRAGPDWASAWLYR
jgi:ABC-type antimicrobial peptide transport system permease subunit